MSQVEKTTYTTSAILDRLVKLLNTDKYYNTVISFKWNPSGTFLFNPIDDSEINDIYLDEGEDFINYLKTAVVMVCNVASEPQGALIQRDLKIVLTPNQTIKFNEWSAKYLNTPISVKCQIIGALKEETYTKSAECYCLKCGHREKIIKNLIPSACENPDCSSRRIVIDDDTKIDGDIKTIIIQEPMEEVRHGAPMTKICVVKDDLVFDSFPGQRKMLTGVFKTEPIKGSSRNKILIHAISMQNLDDENLILPDDIELAEFQQMAKKSDYLEKVIESYAPHIKFRRLEKLAIICSRIGGQSVDGIRARIHSLLIGPPATAKSKLLEFLPQVTQRSGFAIGGMPTGSSITVTMTTLPDRTKFPRGGIVVQCSGSGVALDELNQFPQEDQAKLYECQESGTIHYNKAGFEQLFMADTFIVAGANPKNGYYIESLGMVKNINLPAPMISRFDIIVNVLPEKSKDQSQQISNHTHLIKKIGL